MFSNLLNTAKGAGLFPQRLHFNVSPLSSFFTLKANNLW
jgi:hypothetical protein